MCYYYLINYFMNVPYQLLNFFILYNYSEIIAMYEE